MMARVGKERGPKGSARLGAAGLLAACVGTVSAGACAPAPGPGDGVQASGGAALGSGGVASTGGTGNGGAASGGTTASGGASGGSSASGGSGGVAATGGASSGGTAGASGGSDAGSGGAFSGTCTPSVEADREVSGSGPYDVVVETNADPGIDEGTIYRPAELGGAEKFPIFVWGEGGCSLDGYSNAAAMAEIASHGYFVVADGVPDGEDSRSTSGDGGPLLAYVDWAIAENDKPCSAYYQALAATKVAANGFSCGGLMATGTAGDPRMTTWGHTSSGLFSANQALYDSVHTPVLILQGRDDDLAFENGVRDYDEISAAVEQPIMLFIKDGAGHGGDLFSPGGGEFTQVILAWLNWWMKDDESATGKGALVGASCSFCSDSSWEIQSAHLPP